MTSNATALRSRRLQSLPPYLFVEIDQRRRAKIAAGADVINLGIGDPDRPTPQFIVDAMADAVRKPKYHQYPSNVGTQMLRESAARFMHRRFGVEVDPDRHICCVIGSKEGIFHLPLAVANAGDIVLYPDPSYPVYISGAKFADAEIHDMPLDAENGWKPRLDRVPVDVARRAKLAWINFPGNPTGACAPLAYYDEFVRFCIEHDIVAASDNAYSEIYFETPQPSMWQASSARIDETLGIEFHSCSKTFNMTGWRIGFAVGHPDVIAALADVKGNADSGAFEALQEAAAVGFDHYDHPDVRKMVDVYRERRDVLCTGLQALGWNVPTPDASFFVWGETPNGLDSWEFSNRCLEEADLVLVPGAGLSPHTRNWFRAALTVEVDRMREVVDRLSRIRW